MEKPVIINYLSMATVVELLKSWNTDCLPFSGRNEDARFIITQVKQKINSPYYSSIEEIDDRGNLQAICLYRLYKDYVYVSDLATAPWNLLVDHPLKTRGGPTRLIWRLVELYGLPLQLVSLESAEGFYRKLGFKLDSMDGRFHLDVCQPKSYNNKVHQLASFC